MKKLVLVLVSAVILTVFISFNYLLWDRENKIQNFENINDEKNSSIDSLKAEVKAKSDENKKLKTEIAEYEDLNRNMQLKIANMEGTKAIIDKEIEKNKAFITKLIKQGGFGPIEVKIKSWVEHIEKGNYEEAYNLQYSSKLSRMEKVPVEKYVNNYKGVYKSIKLKSLKQLTEELPKDRSESIIYQVVLEVKKADSNKPSDLIDGANERYIIVEYDREKDEWVMVDILSAL